VRESAHGVINSLLGVHIRRVVIDESGGGACRVSPLYPYRDTDKLVLLRHIVGALAGVAAQRQLIQGNSEAELVHGAGPDAGR
jgi:hypothetical protein